MAEGIDRELLQCTSQLPANCVHHSCSPFLAARYHSLVIKRETIPEDLEITAWTEDGNIMGVRHKKYPHIQVGGQAVHMPHVLKWLGTG